MASPTTLSRPRTDIVTLSKAVRQILDAGAPIDAFGVGTRMDVSADAPYLDMAYKLVKYAGRHVLKTSPGKKTWTGEKQVYRLRGPDGSFARDVIGVRDEPAPQPAAEALLQPVMQNGRRLEQSAPLSVARERCASQLAALPASVRLVRQPTAYRVEFSERLTALQRAVEEELEL